MKIGAMEIYWSRKGQTVREECALFLRTDQEAREITARMARSEVKNYLAELCEQAEVPFDDPASCLRNVWNLYLYGKSPAARKIDDGHAGIKLGYPFEVGGYANHPEQAEQDARPWPPSAGLTFSDDLLAERVAQLERRAAVTEALLYGHTTTCTCPDKYDEQGRLAEGNQP